MKRPRIGRAISSVVAVSIAAALLAACSGSSPDVGSGPSASASAPPTPTVAATIARISAGGYHTCAITPDGSTSCWGLSTYGQLGTAEGGDPTSPASVVTPDGETFTEIAAGNAHTCAIDAAGAVWCWGVDLDGAHDSGTNTPHGPERVGLPDGARTISIDGFYHACAVTEDGAVWCWGRGSEGQLGDGASRDSTDPVEVARPEGITFRQVVTGAFHTCALDAQGSVRCWGQDLRDQLDGADAADAGIPGVVAMPDGVTVTALTAGFNHTCALTDAGDAWCWGEGTNGQLGHGGTADAGEPVAVTMPEGVRFSAIEAGNAHTCAVATDGSVWCWGLGTQGGGADAEAITTTPVRIAFDAVAVVVSAGGFHTCVLTDDGAVWCWGAGSSGQLGTGGTADASTPTEVRFTA